MYGYIYKTTNIITNKIYIGQKKSEKFLGEKYLGSGKRLKSSIKHYGKENFIVIMIDTVETSDELNEKEIYWIDKFNSCDDCIGYNISQGGSVPTGVPAWNKGLTKETSPSLIKSETTKLKHSNSLKCAYAEGRRKPIVYTADGLKRKQTAAKKQRHDNTKGKHWYNNGTINKILNESDLQLEKYKDFVPGKLTNTVPWNKGLNKYNNTIIAEQAKLRKERLDNGEQIGFCNRKGNHFSKGQKVSEYINESNI